MFTAITYLRFLSCTGFALSHTTYRLSAFVGDVLTKKMKAVGHLNLSVRHYTSGSFLKFRRTRRKCTTSLGVQRLFSSGNEGVNDA
ncbi:hypothetical protein C5167_015811 [Papaver somniferum]|uniref:Secreted protein n=1 Tax=Papaver somniferum TaxID=3469 RepID=A0A4Y7JBE2_PAPSO|nr:hypothetical protein C5167_015811 [Papaver somniferum]